MPTSSRSAARLATCALGLLVASARAQTAPPPAATAPAAGVPVQMSVFEVASDRDIGYRALSSLAGSRTGEDLKNVPMPISVLTEEFLRDIDATDLLEAVRFSSSGFGMPTNDNDQQAFQFRGFRSQYQTRNLFVWQAPADAYNIERIDLAKGPNALLFGSSEPGGVANFNTKRAQFTTRSEATFRVGSWDQYRGTLDLNRKLNARVAARLNLVHDERRSWENWVQSEREAAHLAVTYQIGPTTVLRIDAEVGRFDRVPAISLPNDSFSAWNGTTPFAFNAAQNTIRRRIYFAAGDTAQNSALGVPANDAASGIATAFMPTGGKARLWSESTYAGVAAAGSYWDGRLRTNLGLRRDAARNDIQSSERNATTGLMAFTAPRRNVNQVNKYSPTVGGTFSPLGPLTFFANYARTFRAPGTTMTNPLGDSVTVRHGEGKEAGLRLELLEGRFYLTTSAYDITQTGQNHQIPEVAAAMNGIWSDPVLNAIDPTSANKVLTGGTVESQTLNGTGYEIELLANLTPSWSLTAGYSNNINRVGETDVGTLRYVRAKLPEWERLAAGNPQLAASLNAELAAIHDYLLDAVPGLVRIRSNRDTVSLFTRYGFRAGSLKSLTVGGGMSYRSPAALNTRMVNHVIETIWGSAITEYEAMAAYPFRLSARLRGRVQLNVRNLLDRQRYQEVLLIQTRYQAPRSLTLTTRLSF